MFKLTPDGVLATLHAFTDGNAWGLLIQAGDGNLYGANGVHFFRLALDGTRTIIHTLASQPPVPLGLVEGVDGELYGLTNGGSAGFVAFFRLTRAGVFTTIYTSQNYAADGEAISLVPLFVAPDGSLLGTLPLAGPNDRGTLFRVTLSGTFTVLHAMTVQEGRAYSGIVRHPNAHFYGTTVEGGRTGHGMIYSVGFGGSLVVRNPFAPLLPYAPQRRRSRDRTARCTGPRSSRRIQPRHGLPPDFIRPHRSAQFHRQRRLASDRQASTGADGKIYGTTVGGGGPANRGTIFRVSTTAPRRSTVSRSPRDAIRRRE